MHLKTFRKAAERAGINPYLVEMANIREHCSWVHPDREQATLKTLRQSWCGCRWKRCDTTNRFGPSRSGDAARPGDRGGVAGIQAALDIADGGYEVVLVEREPSIGRKDGRPVRDLPHARLLAVQS